MIDQPTALATRAPYHFGIATRNLEAGMAALTDVFAVDWLVLFGGAIDPNAPLNSVARMAHTKQGAVRYELIEGPPGSVWETDALAQLHHVAYFSDDLRTDIDWLSSDGWSVEVDWLPRVCYLVKPTAPRIELTARGVNPTMLQ